MFARASITCELDTPLAAGIGLTGSACPVSRSVEHTVGSYACEGPIGQKDQTHRNFTCQNPLPPRRPCLLQGKLVPTILVFVRADSQSRSMAVVRREADGRFPNSIDKKRRILCNRPLSKARKTRKDLLQLQGAQLRRG